MRPVSNSFRVTIGPRSRGRGGSWPIRCDCGWVEEVIGADSWAREVAEGCGKSHLREAHASAHPEMRAQGKFLALRGIDERLLTKEELSRYRQLVWEATLPKRSQTPVFSMRDTLRLKSYWLGMGIWAVLFVGSGVGLGAADQLNRGSDGTSSAEILSLVGMLLVLFLGTPLVFVQVMREARTVLQRRVDDYLDSIGLHTRTRRPGRRMRSDDDYEHKSTRQLQHEWYGDHSELTWHDRVLGETLGIPDADTYVSNFLEHDKD